MWTFEEFQEIVEFNYPHHKFRYHTDVGTHLISHIAQTASLTIYHHYDGKWSIYSKLYTGIGNTIGQAMRAYNEQARTVERD